MNVLVTGGAGYIGSHVCLALRHRGDQVVVLDNFSTGSREAVFADQLIEGDVGDRRLLSRVLQQTPFDAIIHLAGSIVAPASVAEPDTYYSNNLANSIALATECRRAGVRAFVFSSTAAVYGETVRPAAETDPTSPSTPYGWSKLMMEQVLRDMRRAYPDFRSVALRYFNVAGADCEGRAGQVAPSASLVRAAVEVAVGLRPHLSVFGVDYPTRDGSCERDFIHVSDLAQAHLDVLDYARCGGAHEIFNCGYGKGFTVLEVMSALDRVTGRQTSSAIEARRPGDVASCVSDSSLLRAETGWNPRHDNLEEILSSSLAWEQRLSQMKSLTSVNGSFLVAPSGLEGRTLKGPWSETAPAWPVRFSRSD